MERKDVLKEELEEDLDEEELDEEIKICSKKKYILINTIAISTFVLGFIVMFILAILQEKGIVGNIAIGVFSIIGIWLFDIILLIYHYKEMMGYTLDKASKADLSKYLVINENEYNINEYLERKFKYLDSNYYHKKYFSLYGKEYVNIFVKKIETENIINGIDNELELFDSFEFKQQHKALLLFVEKSKVAEEDIKYLTNLSRDVLINEAILRDDCSLFVVLRDKNNKKTYFIKSGKYIFTMYHKVYKTLLKILNFKNY